jgi:hypothetical protein
VDKCGKLCRFIFPVENPSRFPTPHVEQQSFAAQGFTGFFHIFFAYLLRLLNKYLSFSLEERECGKFYVLPLRTTLYFSCKNFFQNLQEILHFSEL